MASVVDKDWNPPVHTDLGISFIKLNVTYFWVDLPRFMIQHTHNGTFPQVSMHRIEAYNTCSGVMQDNLWYSKWMQCTECNKEFSAIDIKVKHFQPKDDGTAGKIIHLFCLGIWMSPFHHLSGPYFSSYLVKKTISIFLVSSSEATSFLGRAQFIKNIYIYGWTKHLH